MFNQTQVFVILVNYNGLKDTLECIRSIYKSIVNASVSIVIVDNASKEDEAIKIKEVYPDVITLRSEVNGGFSAGNNIGITYALENSADYIMLLNNDTIIASDMISILLEECAEDVVTVPKMFYYGEPQKIWYGGGKIKRWTGSAVHLKMDKLDEPDDEKFFCSFATGCCIMMKAEIFKKVGFLNENYFMYYEDVDFSIRLAYEHIKIEYLPDAKLWHKVSSSTGGSHSPLATYYLTRNRLNCVRDNKEYFYITAKWFSLITRYVRALQAKDKNVKVAFIQGINDFYKHRYGLQINS